MRWRGTVGCNGRTDSCALPGGHGGETDATATHDFSLVCGYSMGNFYKDAAIEEICSHHSHILSGTGEAALVN